MGYLKERYLMMLLSNIKPEACPECGVVHPPEQPHNQQSLAYQYNFYDKHGRWPTWEDAMAHCPEEIQDLWKDELSKRGVKV